MGAEGELMWERIIGWLLRNWTPGRGVVQMPVSEILPPVPMSMRSHYAPGELDEQGYRVA